MRIAARRTPMLLALALACAVAACGGGGGSKPTNGIQGTITYERVPTTDANGLAYSATQRRPVRGAVVQLYDLSNPQSPTPVGAATTTDDAGHYSLAVPANAPAQVSVVAVAETQSPPMRVLDNTSSGASYAIFSPAFATGPATKDLNAPSGWTGNGYDPNQRLAAPFAILDSMYTAARAFLAARPSAPFAPLTLYWSARNEPSTGQPDYPSGQIGTSHWNGTALYILGAENIDTDEFDDHVIVHEWGHYFESTLSRSDSPGGPHGAGDAKDLRLAFGEGWGNAVSAMTLADPVYRDTAGQGQSRTVVRDDMEGTASDPNPGFFSERSVSKILYDVYDPANEPSDQVALGLGPIYDVMVGGEKNTPALTSIYSFVTELKKANPAQAAAIDVLTAERGIHVNDEWGTGETNVPPSATNPIYGRLTAPVNTPLQFFGADASGTLPFNDLAQNYYLRFTGDNGTHTARTATLAPGTGTPGTQGKDVDIYVFHRGQLLNQGSAGQTNAADETVQFQTQLGEEYVIVLTGFGDVARYDVQFTFQ